MTLENAERLKHVGRVGLLLSALGNVGSVLFFAAGFGFVTPQKTLAEFRRADSTARSVAAALAVTVDQNNQARIVDRDDQNRKLHALLVIECLTAKPAIRARVNVDCIAVLREGAIQ